MMCLLWLERAAWGWGGFVLPALGHRSSQSCIRYRYAHVTC